MMSLNEMWSRVSRFDVEALGLRPPYPPVVVEMDRHEAALVRLRRRRRGQYVLEAHQSCAMDEQNVPSSIFEPVSSSVDELAGRLRELFESTGTRPGRVSLLLPDNLAKITLLRLPERPGSRVQLDQLVQAKMRRAVPFRLEEASLTYQLLPGAKREVAVLVVLVRRALVERFESALGSIGATTGLIDICTPNLMNLCRDGLATGGQEPGDAALLNCSRNYFSLAIVRESQLIFFRCKSFMGGTESPEPNGVLAREVGNSFAYYREKLGGVGVRRMLVRTVTRPFEEIAGQLEQLGCVDVRPIDVTQRVQVAEGPALDVRTAHELAPAIGAAMARGG